MPRPKATPEQAERRRLRRAWASKTEHQALRALAVRHRGEFAVLLNEIRAADPWPEATPG